MQFCSKFDPEGLAKNGKAKRGPEHGEICKGAPLESSIMGPGKFGGGPDIHQRAQSFLGGTSAK